MVRTRHLSGVFLCGLALALPALTVAADTPEKGGPAAETRFVLKGHTNTVHAVAFSPDNNWIATASEDKTIRLWDASTGQRKERIAHTSPIYCLAFSPDGKLLAAGDADKAVTLWDATSGEKKKALPRVSDQPVAWVRFSPDSRFLATLGVGGRKAMIWDVRTGEKVATLTGHDGAITELEFSPDGGLVATASRDSTIRLWDPATGKEKDSLRAHEGSVNCLAFDLAGRKIATGGEDKTVVVWDVKKGNIIQPVLKGHTKTVESVSFAPDGRVVSGASGGGLSLWSTSDGRRVVLREDFKGRVLNFGGFFYPSHIALAPDGKSLAVTAPGNEVEVLDISRPFGRAK